LYTEIGQRRDAISAFGRAAAAANVNANAQAEGAVAVFGASNAGVAGDVGGFGGAEPAVAVAAEAAAAAAATIKAEACEAAEAFEAYVNMGALYEAARQPFDALESLRRLLALRNASATTQKQRNASAAVLQKLPWEEVESRICSLEKEIADTLEGPAR
jgi:tetratricopeptide (TPR) repeat protein